MNREPCQYQQRNRVARHAFDDALGGIGMANLASNHRIEPEHLVATEGDVSLRRIGLLSL